MYVGLIAVGVLAYANSLSGPFIFDDIPAIVENADIREVLPLWRSPAESDRPSINSRPVVRLSLSLNNAFGGLEVRGYHLANIGFHILCALLLAVCLQRTLVLSSMAPSVSKYAESLASASPPPRLRLASASALIWLLHPVNNQTVNYVTQRSEALVAVFFLGTLYALLRGACGGRRWLLVSVVACLLGMGSKEVMVSAPILALLFDRTFLAGDFASALRVRRAYYLALSSTWVVLIALMWARPHGDSIGLDLGVGTIGYGLSQAGALLVYLKLLVWPQPLLIDYALPRSLQWQTRQQSSWRSSCCWLPPSMHSSGGRSWVLLVHGFSSFWLRRRA